MRLMIHRDSATAQQAVAECNHWFGDMAVAQTIVPNGRATLIEWKPGSYLALTQQEAEKVIVTYLLQWQRR